MTIPRERIDELPSTSAAYAFLSPSQPVVSSVGSNKEIVNKLAGASIAAFVEVWKINETRRETGDASYGFVGPNQPTRYGAGIILDRSGRRIVTGVITKRDITDRSTTLRCLTEEILLERIRTPAQYGRVYDGQDLADVARDLRRGWHVLRVKDQTQWDAAISRSNVDTSTEPGLVLLAKSGGRYVASGQITLRFQSSDVPNFEAWDRIRWSSDHGGPVRTTMQYRFGASPGSMGSWSSEIIGALPDEIGVVPQTNDAAILDVRINLYTDDRDSEDPNGNPVGQTPAVYAVEMIARTGAVVDLGNIPLSTGATIDGVEADDASALSVLQAACAQAEWEFEVEDGKLNLRQMLGEDRTDEFVLRATTNMEIDALGDDDRDLVNILTAYGPGDGLDRLRAEVRDQVSIDFYGPYHGTHFFDGVSTLSELIAAADDYLSLHSTPVQRFRVRAAFDPDGEPVFGRGDRVRVVDPESEIVTTARIVEEIRSYGTGGVSIRLNLGRVADNLVSATLGTREAQPRLGAPTGFHHQFDQGLLFLSWQRGTANAWEIWHSQQTQNNHPVNFQHLATVGSPRYEHEGLEIGSDNWYMFYARAGSRRSLPGGPYHVRAKDTTAPATPSNLVVAAHIKGVTASIAPNQERDLRRYIWEKRVDSGPWEVFAEDLVTDRVISAESAQVVAIRVRAEDTSGNVSPPTPVQSAISGAIGRNDLEPDAIFTISGNATDLRLDGGASSLVHRFYIRVPAGRKLVLKRVRYNVNHSNLRLTLTPTGVGAGAGSWSGTNAGEVSPDVVLVDNTGGASSQNVRMQATVRNLHSRTRHSANGASWWFDLAFES